MLHLGQIVLHLQFRKWLKLLGMPYNMDNVKTGVDTDD